MMAFDHVEVATLSATETAHFASIVSELPESVLSDDSVETERAKERQAMDDEEEGQGEESEQLGGEEADEFRASMLRVFRNNKILGQVLRNQYGKLPRRRIEEIVDTIADSSFRIINLSLADEDKIHGMAQHIKAKYPEAEIVAVQQMLRYISFIWTMIHVEQAVHAVSVPSIREAVTAVVERNRSPAYEIFGYFCKLDSADGLTSRGTRCTGGTVQSNSRPVRQESAVAQDAVLYE